MSFAIEIKKQFYNIVGFKHYKEFINQWLD